MESHTFQPKLNSLNCRECLRLVEFHPQECACPVADTTHRGAMHGIIGGTPRQGRSCK